MFAGAVLFALCTFSFLVPLAFAEDHDAGESPKEMAMKNRAAAPKASEIDASVTLDAMVAAKEEGALHAGKGATVTGYVVQAEREEDGDVHMVLAAKKGETLTSNWVIVESTPAWQKKSASLSAARLRRLIGREVQVTGWLFYEPDVEDKDPRGTRWELHPITSIKVMGAAAK
jgi:hypothetical protein